MENSSTSNASSSSHSEVIENLNEESMDSRSRHAANIILNHDFSGGLHFWQPNSCHAFVNSEESGYPGAITAKLSGRYAVVTDRKESWQGLEQVIERVSTGCTCTVCAWVGVSGARHGVDNVDATLRLEYGNSEVEYLPIGSIAASMEDWEKVEGTFSLPTMPDRVIFYLEGPSPGVDLLIRSVQVFSSSAEYDSQTGSTCDGDRNIILNPEFDNDLHNWSGKGCKIALHDSMADGKVLPMSGKRFASTADRTQNWNGIKQEITGRVQPKLAYEVAAVVRIYGNRITSSNVTATVWVQAPDLREHRIEIASVKATDENWVQLQGRFLVNCSPARVEIYLEGPPRGTDILLNNLVVKHAPKVPPSLPPVIENPAFGVNIISNSNLSNGTNGWFPVGDCTLTIGNGSPHILPPMAQDSLGLQKPLSGRYVLVTNRTHTWMGPAQTITDKLELYLTYQVSAWVRIGSRATRPQNISVTLKVDDQWVNCGEVEIKDDKWLEIGGSFRIEKIPVIVTAYVHGPDAGLDLLVAGLHIFPVDRHARFRHLKQQTEKIRKRDIILKFTSDPRDSLGASVKIRQIENSFPFGSCMNRTDIDNEDFVDFFSKNFNWAVFGYELKWDWTEPRRGKLNYKEADELLDFCSSRNIQVRGHCIFWEVEAEVPSWVHGLNKDDLLSAVEERLESLLTRYKGKFKHYDVNNEMLHGSFYQDRLGKKIRAYMFEEANKLDLDAILFVNDYHIEDGYDARSSPEKYIEHILDLKEQKAPIGGIGIQGNIDSPVGAIVCSALDKLRDKIPELPIWFTEITVSSNNEYVRADDLEVMLREAFAHPAVDGVMLWGFWELLMSRDNAHLVNAEGDINEAGKRYVALKQEWLSHAHGHIDKQGQFEFRGFQGSYEVEIVTPSKKVTKTFDVYKGEKPLVISISL